MKPPPPAWLPIPTKSTSDSWDEIHPVPVMRSTRGAARAHERLRALGNAADEAGEQLFTRQIHVLRLTVSAWIAHAEGNGEHALEMMREAAEQEVGIPKSPVTPAPTLPAHELLGDLLLVLERHDEALAAFERSLERYPKRFNSLLGAARGTGSRR